MKNILILMMMFVITACGSSDEAPAEINAFQNDQTSNSVVVGAWDDANTMWDNAIFGD